MMPGFDHIMPFTEAADARAFAEKTGGRLSPALYDVDVLVRPWQVRNLFETQEDLDAFKAQHLTPAH